MHEIPPDIGMLKLTWNALPGLQEEAREWNDRFLEPQVQRAQEEGRWQRRKYLLEEKLRIDPSNLTDRYRLIMQQYEEGFEIEAINLLGRTVCQIYFIPASDEKVIGRVMEEGCVEYNNQGKGVRQEKPAEELSIEGIIYHSFNADLMLAGNQALELSHKTDKRTENMLLTAYFTEAHDDIDLTVLVYATLLNRFNNESEWKEREIYTESRNKVSRLNNHPLSGFVLIKEYNKSRTLAVEKANTKAFRHVLGDSVQRIVAEIYRTPEEMREVLGDAYEEIPPLLVVRTAGTETLMDVVKGNDDERKRWLLKDAARLLARIHTTGNSIFNCMRLTAEELIEAGYDDFFHKKVKDTYGAIEARMEWPAGEHFTQRVKDILFTYANEETGLAIDGNSRDRIVRGHAAVNDHLLQLEMEYYKDHNPRNVVLDDLDNLIAIDFETLKVAPCQIDLVSLLEFGSDYITEDERRDVIEEYLKVKEKLSGREIDREEFMLGYRYAQVQRHIELIGYCSRDRAITMHPEEESKRQKYHIEKAKEAVSRLIAQTRDERLEGLLEGLEGLEVHSH
ncbi:TPA: phosphotransferase [Candidatus Woesearchaeota archaeon]|nr:phosphotransferase [Candidatus Woesearchaeota archaeon]